MKPDLNLIPDTVHVYQELMPSEDPGFKESVSREEATLARMADMKFKAMLQGRILEFKTKDWKDDDLSGHFQERPVHSKEEIKNLEKVKLVKLELLDYVKKDE